MSKPESKKTLQELTSLVALEKAGAHVDTSDIPEVLDWSQAVVGKFYHAPVKKPSWSAKLLSGILRVIRRHPENRTPDALETSKGVEIAAKLLSRILRQQSKSRTDATSRRIESAAAEWNLYFRKIEQTQKTHSHEPNFDRDKMICWLVYQRGYTAQEIASLPFLELTTKDVEDILLSLTRRLYSELPETKRKPTT